MKQLNQSECSKTQRALQNAERVNSRNERFISLKHLKKQLELQNVSEDDFKTYLYAYAPKTQYDYIEAVSKQLYHTADSEISDEEKFLITSGLC